MQYSIIEVIFILLFFLIIITTLLILGIIAYLLYLVLPWGINKLEKGSKNVSRCIVRNITGGLNIWRWIVYVVILINTIFVLYFSYLLVSNKEMWNLVAIFIYPVLMIFFSTLQDELNKKLQKSGPSLISKIPSLIKESYFVDRVKLLLGNTLLHIGIYLIIFYVLLEVVNVTLDDEQIPLDTLYFFFIMLPVFLVTFIYFKVKEKDERNLRRIISYLILLVFAIMDSYSQFQELLGEEGMGSAFNYMSYVIIAVFTALDNFVGAIYNDRDLYRGNNK